MVRLRQNGHILGRPGSTPGIHFGYSGEYVPPVNVAPTATFTSVVTDLAVTVTSTSTDPDGTIASQSWAWGDGATSAGPTATHTYATAGSKTITLTVTDNSGATGTTSQTVTTTAPNVAPVASFTTAKAGLTVTATSTSTDSDGSISSYAWAWGDGSNSTGATASHVYAADGTYTVTLTVTDNAGGTNTATSSVTVTAPVQGKTFAAMPAFPTIFHRGGTGNPALAPEESEVAMEMALSMGADAFDVDVQETSDGVLVAFHDSTVDRVTAATGTVASRTFANMPAINMPEVVGEGWAPQPVLSIDQVLTKFGGRVVLNLEPKSAGDVGALISMIQSRGLQSSVIVNSSDAAVIAQVTAAGLYGHVWGVTNNATIDTAATASPDIIEFSASTTPTTALVDYAKAKEGVRYVVAGPTVTRYARQVAMAAGCHAVVNDAPGYVNAVQDKRNLTDEIASKKVGAGWWRRPNNSGAYLMPWFNTDGIVISQGTTTATTADSTYNVRTNVRFGTLCGPKPGTYSYKIKLRWDAVPNSGSRVGFRFCAVDDRVGGNDTEMPPTYSTNMRANGTVDLYVKTTQPGSSTFTQIGSVASPAITAAGTVTTLRVDITPTTVQVTREETGHTTGAIANTAVRGDYHFVEGNTYGYPVTLLGLDIVTP